MARLDLDSGRINQKLKTRKSILHAANRVLSKNPNPSLEEIAEEAMISRATIYRYFPNPEALLLEAALELKIQEPEEILANAGNDAIGRVLKIHEFLYDLSANNEVKFRQFIRATLSMWLDKKDKDIQLRSGRRIRMLEEALKDKRADLDEETYQKLIYALSAIVGIEAFIALKDVCEVSNQEGKEIMQWAVEKLLEAVLNPKVK